jgi:hypothetical protein
MIDESLLEVVFLGLWFSNLCLYFYVKIQFKSRLPEMYESIFGASILDLSKEKNTNFMKLTFGKWWGSVDDPFMQVLLKLNCFFAGAFYLFGLGVLINFLVRAFFTILEA